jgi:hypothetical protein
MKKRYATSKVLAVRFHLDELETLNKKRKKKPLSVYVREKSLDLTT